MSDRKPFETYAHYKIGKGFATLAVSVDAGLARVGVSYCHPRDSINKSFGRNVATARRDIGSDFSFEFVRDSRKLGEQLRAEFECFVIDAGRDLMSLKTITAQIGEAAAVEGRIEQRLGAPPWVIHSLNREIRKRHLFADSTIDIFSL